MYSSSISAPLVTVNDNPDVLLCETRQPCKIICFTSMELYNVGYWYEYNVEGFGRPHYTDWDLFWFQDNLGQWSV